MSILDSLKGRLNLKKTVPVGIDISTDGIVIARLSKAKSRFAVEALALGPLPPETLADGEITDPQAVASAVRQLLDDHGIEATTAVVGVGGQNAVIRLVSMPEMPEEELLSYIQYEAERYIPFAIDDVNLSTQILGDSPEGDDQMEVLLVAAQKRLVQSFIDTADEAGFGLSCVDVGSFAVMRALTHTGYLNDDEAVGVLLIQGPSTDINIVASGVPKFNRCVFIGYNYLVDNLVNSLGIDEDHARSLLEQIDVDPDQYTELPPELEQATEIIRPALSELTGEISRSLDYFLSQGTATIDRVVICGKGATLRGLDRFLTARLGIEVVLANPFAGLDTGAHDVDENSAAEYITAVGLAMRGLDDQ